MEAVDEALARHGKPEAFNTGQGSHFTSDAFTGPLENSDIAISMEGKGAWRDNVFVGRFWRSMKYEGVYLKACASVTEALLKSKGERELLKLLSVKPTVIQWQTFCVKSNGWKCG